MAIYAYNVELKRDQHQYLKGTIVSTNKGIEIGVVPDSSQEYVEREYGMTGDILWCSPDDYYEDSEGLLEFLSGEGFDGNPFTEIT